MPRFNQSIPTLTRLTDGAGKLRVGPRVLSIDAQPRQQRRRDFGNPKKGSDQVLWIRRADAATLQIGAHARERVLEGLHGLVKHDNLVRFIAKQANLSTGTIEDDWRGESRGILDFSC